MANKEAPHIASGPRQRPCRGTPFHSTRPCVSQRLHDSTLNASGSKAPCCQGSGADQKAQLQHEGAPDDLGQPLAEGHLAEDCVASVGSASRRRPVGPRGSRAAPEQDPDSRSVQEKGLYERLAVPLLTRPFLGSHGVGGSSAEQASQHAVAFSDVQQARHQEHDGPAGRERPLVLQAAINHNIVNSIIALPTDQQY